jgi:uncharacterized protein (TIGR00369 family)
MTDDAPAAGSGSDSEALITMMPFALSCGIELDEAGAQRVSGSMAWSPERSTAGGILHGGAVMTLADTLGAVCAFLNLEPGASTSTIESKTNFFRALRSGRAHGSTTPLHVGRTTIVVQTDVTDDDGKHLAQVTQTQAVLRR